MEVICDLDKSSFSEVFISKLIEVGLREREGESENGADRQLFREVLVIKGGQNGVVAGGGVG